jgi:hypothetical protein
LFFVEVELAYEALNILKQQKQRTTDGVPDLLAIAFTKFRSIVQKYGERSSHTFAAAFVIDSVVNEVNEISFIIIFEIFLIFFFLF